MPNAWHQRHGLPTSWERETSRIDLDAVEPRWLVYSGGFRSSLIRRISQRVLDIWVSLLGLAITLPLMPLVALLIRVDSPGPIFYRQERSGKDDVPFQNPEISQHVRECGG